MGGGRMPTVSDEEILDVIRTADPPFLGTREISNELPIKKNGTLNRLNELEEAGEVRSKKVGTVLIWWIPETS
jgi:Mn-dependent DtxR family transcriptional regulator